MSARDTDKILNGPLKSDSAPPIKSKLSTQILAVLGLLLLWGVGGYLIWGVANEGRSAAQKGTEERPLLQADIDELIDAQAGDDRRFRRLTSRRVKQNKSRIVNLTRIIEGSPGAPGAIGLGRQGEPGVGFAGPIGPIGFGTPGERGEPGVGTPGEDGQDGESIKGDKGDPCLAADPACRGPQGEDGPPPTDEQVKTAVDAFLLSHTLTCEPTADPLDPPARQTCTFDP